MCMHIGTSEPSESLPKTLFDTYYGSTHSTAPPGVHAVLPHPALRLTARRSVHGSRHSLIEFEMALGRL